MTRSHHALALAALLLAAPAWAQNQAAAPAGPPNALQGFQQNRDKPVQIDAASLEVRDKTKTATFSGNVQVVQGDTTLRCKALVVFYDQEGLKQEGGKPQAAPTKTSLAQGGGQQRIRRLEAKGDVVVTQKDQIATGETGIYDMPSNTVTLTGNVVVTQGQNTLKGDRLLVDLGSGVSRLEAGKSTQGRVQGLFLPSSMPHDGKPGGIGDNKTPRSTQSQPAPQQSQGPPQGAPQPQGAPRPRSPSGLY